MTEIKRYNRIAIVLHWVMAIAFIAMLVMGLTMSDISDKAFRFQVYQWHKSLGILLLIAIFLRILVRVLSVRPPLPEEMKKSEKLLAHLGHFALYVAMFLIPFSGWIMVSSSQYGLPTIVFGWFEWPHIEPVAQNKTVRGISGEVHEIVANGLIGLIVLHIAAVVKHWLVDKQNLLPRMGIGKVAIALMLLAAPANAAPYSVDYDKSEIAFSGEHAGTKFEGKFNKWSAKIDFDEANLPASKIEVEVETASAETGNKMYDGTLPSQDWFDVANHPKAKFESTEIVANSNGSFTARGVLTIRDVAKPIEFNFVLNEGKANFELPIDRLAFGLGTGSDPKSEWVSQQILLKVAIDATKQS